MRSILRLCLQGVKANALPGIALQVIACLVVGAYYFVPAAEGGFAFVSDLKLEFGYVYSALSTALFGGVIPFIYLRLSGKVRSEECWSVAAFFTFFWMFKGVEVDLLYRFQAWLFGEGADAATVASKVAFDQFVFCPFWSAPVTALFYRWKENGFCWSKTRSDLGWRFVKEEVGAVLVSIWMVWIPGTAFIYSMPSNLQLPLFNLVLCFYVLLVSALAGENQETRPSR